MEGEQRLAGQLQGVFVTSIIIYNVCRAKLFKLINGYPTLFEVVTGRSAGGTRNSSKPSGVSTAGRSTLPAKRKEPSSVSIMVFDNSSCILDPQAML